jgi:hypothetical protein
MREYIDRGTYHRSDRLYWALKELPTLKAKTAFENLVKIYPDFSIFWGDGTAILEDDDVSIEVS